MTILSDHYFYSFYLTAAVIGFAVVVNNILAEHNIKKSILSKTTLIIIAGFSLLFLGEIRLVNKVGVDTRAMVHIITLIIYLCFTVVVPYYMNKKTKR